MQVPPNCDLTLGMVCIDKSSPGAPSGRCPPTSGSPTRPASSRGAFWPPSATRPWGRPPSPSSRAAGWSAANAEMKVSFLAPVAVGAVLTCAAEVVAGGGRAAFVEADGDRREDGTWWPGPARPISSASGGDTRRLRCTGRRQATAGPAGASDEERQEEWVAVRPSGRGRRTPRPLAPERGRHRPAGRRLRQAGDPRAAQGRSGASWPSGRRLAGPLRRGGPAAGGAAAAPADRDRRLRRQPPGCPT